MNTWTYLQIQHSVRVNAWFWAIGAPFHSSKKIGVYMSNDDPGRRRRHEAYVVCIFNTFKTRQLMNKALPGDVDDHALHIPDLDADNRYQITNLLQGPAAIHPASAQLPRCFKLVKYPLDVIVFVRFLYTTLQQVKLTFHSHIERKRILHDHGLG